MSETQPPNQRPQPNQPRHQPRHQPQQWIAPSPGAWELDSHFPFPVTPTHAANLTSAFSEGFRVGTRRLGLLLDYEEICVVNGFPYHTPRIVGAPKAAKGPPPRAIFKLLTWLHPEIRRRLRVCATVFESKPWLAEVARFEGETRPEATETHRRLQAIDPAKLDTEGLISHLATLQANATLRYRQHHEYTVTILVPVGDFLAHATEWTGRSIAECLRSVDGGGRGPAAGSERELGDLARLVRSLPTGSPLRARLAEEASPGQALQALRNEPGEIGAAARAWLDVVGNRLVTGYDVADLTALEMPELLLRTLRAAMADVGASHASPADARAAELRELVPAAHRVRYDELLADARAIARVRDERALVLDLWAYGILRKAVLEAGRRLVEDAKIAEAAHLVDASHEEMVALLGGSGGPSLEELSARARYRAATTLDAAPPRLGFAPSGPPPIEWMPENCRRMMRAIEIAIRGLFTEYEARPEPARISGLGASAGIYEGRARLVLGPADFGKLNQGDVLVTRSTTEAFNVVLPLLGAVVTDRGGLLCHAATVAREYGIPAIVGSRDATRRIGDGARVRVDGSSGFAEVVA